MVERSRRRMLRLTSPTFAGDRKSTRLNSSHLGISYAVFCLKKKKPESKAMLHVRPEQVPGSLVELGAGECIEVRIRCAFAPYLVRIHLNALDGHTRLQLACI